MSINSIKHLEELVTWAKNAPSRHQKLFLIENLAPLVLGKKPAVLLNVFFENPKEWETFKLLFSQQRPLQNREIRTLNRRRQIFFYQQDILDSLLGQDPILDFLKTLNYPAAYSLETYLGFLQEKIVSLKFPDEIGVFLGYPLKDVLGFMGLLPLPYIKTQGWRIYGDEKLSDKVYAGSKEARHLMRRIAGDCFGDQSGRCYGGT